MVAAYTGYRQRDESGGPAPCACLIHRRWDMPIHDRRATCYLRITRDIEVWDHGRNRVAIDGSVIPSLISLGFVTTGIVICPIDEPALGIRECFFKGQIIRLNPDGTTDGPEWVGGWLPRTPVMPPRNPATRIPGM